MTTTHTFFDKDREGNERNIDAKFHISPYVQGTIDIPPCYPEISCIDYYFRGRSIGNYLKGETITRFENELKNTYL